MIEVHLTVPVPELALEDLRAAVERALEHGGWSGGRVDVVLVDDARIAELHGRFLGDPTPTDVIAFDLGDEERCAGERADGEDDDGEDDDGPAAEIYVSTERAREVAGRRGAPVARELALYLVHGALHLCGFDDDEESDRARMRAAEAGVLSALGYPADDAPHELGS